MDGLALGWRTEHGWRGRVDRESLGMDSFKIRPEIRSCIEGAWPGSGPSKVDAASTLDRVVSLDELRLDDVDCEVLQV
jgi:hypothetical protein